MDYYVRLAKDCTRAPAGIPAGWPAEIWEIKDEHMPAPHADCLRLTGEELAALKQAHAEAHAAWLDTRRLTNAKAAGCIAVDQKTRAAIAEGHIRKGVPIPLSTTLLARLTAFMLIRDSLEYPIWCASADDLSAVSIESAEELEETFSAVTTEISRRVGAGVAQKRAIQDAATLEAVEHLVASYDAAAPEDRGKREHRPSSR